MTHLPKCLLLAVVVLRLMGNCALGGEAFCPSALLAERDGKSVLVACFGANKLLRVDLGTRQVVTNFPLPGSPSGLALSRDGANVFVTCAAPQSLVCVLDSTTGKLLAQIKVGHSACAPVPTSDGKTLLLCNRFNNSVSVIDLQARKELRRIKVQREPVAADVTPDGKYLLVANALPACRADISPVAAVVSVIDLAAGQVIKELALPNGSSSVCDLRISPDGKYAALTHILSRYPMPTTQLERGWMNTNAKTLIDLSCMEILNTVLLDNLDRGAANPWGIAWSANSATLVVAHAGTHELSVIDFPTLLAKLAKIPVALDKNVPYVPSASHVQADVPNDLGFLLGVRRRIKLPSTDRGPRAVVMAGSKICAANYFSDSLSIIDTATDPAKVESICLTPSLEMSQVRKGEFYFHDASICFQGWQSCASCHPGGGRVDGLNWDLLNDGVGNPKNTKSLLLAHRTPPAMSLAARDSAEAAVRAGIEHILFSAQPEEVAQAIDAYLKSLTPEPSPYRVNGHFSAAAERGQKVFKRAGCAACHPAGLFTDLHSYDVGTRGRFDKATDRFDTPTLVELWRTASYLHDGSAVTVREIFTDRNPQDRHGRTSQLSPQQIDDLCAYLLSL